MFFTFPEDARWNAERQAVEFGIGAYEGGVLLPRRVFERLLPQSPTPERCLGAYNLQRTRFERIAERKLRGQTRQWGIVIELFHQRGHRRSPDGHHTRDTGVVGHGVP